MSSGTRVEASRDLSKSPFPLDAQWGLPWRPWYEHYPRGVPRGLTYPELRAEQLLIHATKEYSDRFAVRYFRTHWTFRELSERIRQVAANLQHMDIGPGDRVILSLPNSPEFVVAWFALQWIGAQVVPANPLYAAEDFVHLAKLTEAKAIIGLDLKIDPVLEMTRAIGTPILITSSLAPHLPWHLSVPYKIKNWLTGRIDAGAKTRVERFESLYDGSRTPLSQPVLTDAKLSAVLQPTGGTTGTPKVAVLTHLNLLANVAQLHVWSGCEPGNEVVLAVIPFFHVFGTTLAFLSSLAGGATLLLQAKFDASCVWKLMEQYHPSVAPMVPMMFAALNEQMAKRGKNIEGLRMCLSGAAPLDPEVQKEFQDRTGARIFEGYGLSEASPVTHANPPDSTARPGSIGLPLPGTLAKIMDVETGTKEMPPGKVGELVVSGPQVMAGYLNAPAETERVLRDGWLYTGDLARMNEEGFFTIVDRKKDLIISGGLKVFPSEVEKVLAAHPIVRECAVVGAPDKLYGERVVGYVVTRSSGQLIEEQLQKHCRKHLAAYKVPRSIKLCEKLPTTFLGKVRRSELRATEAAGGTGHGHDDSPGPKKEVA